MTFSPTPPLPAAVSNHTTKAEDAEDEGGLPGWQRSSQNSTASAVPKQEHQPQAASSSLRGTYDVNRKGLAGPLSVNDPQLLEPPTHRLRFTNSESFFNIASPFGPPGASNTWSLSRRDAPEHVHLLLRALMAAHDYAGAARALATLHRLHSLFDPDVYRYTVALLRLAGDHQVTAVLWPCSHHDAFLALQQHRCCCCCRAKCCTAESIAAAQPLSHYLPRSKQRLCRRHM